MMLHPQQGGRQSVSILKKGVNRVVFRGVIYFEQVRGDAGLG